MFGSRHSCLEFQFRVGVRRSGFVCGLEFARSCALLSTCVVLCGMQFVLLSAACFHVVMSCVNTWLMSIIFSCVFMSCLAHGW